MNGIIIGETCPYCSKQRSPQDIIRLSAFTICQDCWQRHLKAMEGLSTGKYTGECSECGKSVDELKLRQGSGDTGVRMAIHFENGIYRPMCMLCDRTYVPKRADLYGKTEFWRQRAHQA
jgi:hypothetical protein